MKKQFKSLVSNPLISGSTIVLLGTTLANAFHFFFNFFLVRNIPPSDYGTYTLLTTITTLVTLGVGALTPTIVRFAAGYFANNELAHAKGLYLLMFRLTGSIAILVLLVSILGSTTLASFFHINNAFYFVITGFILFFSFVLLVNNSFIQAKLKFGYIAVVNLVGGASKFFLGLFLVTIGWGLSGALGALVASFLLPFVLGFLPLKFVFTKHSSTPKIPLKEVLVYGAPSAVALFCLTGFISADVIIVKHFFSPEKAGAYAAVTTIGKIIFYLTAPIGSVMFPMIVQKHVRQEKFHNIFLLSIALVLAPSLILIALYFSFPHQLISLILHQNIYQQSAAMLGYYGIFITLYAILYLFINFFLSIKRTVVFIPVLIALLSQIVLLWFFHSSFVEVVLLSILISGLLLVCFLLYYLKLYAGTEKKI